MKNLEATLPPIIFIRDIFHLSLQEQDHQEGAGVRERYENATQLEFEASNNEEFEVDDTLEAEQRLYPDLSEGLPVINDTTDLSEGLPVINDTTDLSEGLPVINDTTNLSEGLPVIDDTSTMTT